VLAARVGDAGQLARLAGTSVGIVSRGLV
jgi:ribosomal protein L2